MATHASITINNNIHNSDSIKYHEYFQEELIMKIL